MYFYNANKSHLNRHQSRESRETMADSVISKLIYLMMSQRIHHVKKHLEKIIVKRIFKTQHRTNNSNFCFCPTHNYKPAINVRKWGIFSLLQVTAFSVCYSLIYRETRPENINTFIKMNSKHLTRKHIPHVIVWCSTNYVTRAGWVHFYEETGK